MSCKDPEDAQGPRAFKVFNLLNLFLSRSTGGVFRY